MNTGDVPHEPHSYGTPGQVLGALLFPKPSHLCSFDNNLSNEA
jgi:hypothetical protein